MVPKAVSMGEVYDERRISLSSSSWTDGRPITNVGMTSGVPVDGVAIHVRDREATKEVDQHGTSLADGVGLGGAGTDVSPGAPHDGWEHAWGGGGWALGVYSAASTGVFLSVEPAPAPVRASNE